MDLHAIFPLFSFYFIKKFIPLDKFLIRTPIVKFLENSAGGSGSDRDKNDEANGRLTHWLRKAVSG